MEARRSVTPNGPLIDALRKQKGWTIEELSRQSGAGLGTTRKAVKGRRLGMESLGWIAEALGTDYRSLLAGGPAVGGPRMQAQVVVEVDIRKAVPEQVAGFVGLITTLLPGVEIVVRHVGEGSVVITLDMPLEDVQRLVGLYPHLPEAARVYLRTTPEGQAYFRGEAGPGAERVGRLLEMVDAVTELRIREIPPEEPDSPEPAAAREKTKEEQIDEILDIWRKTRFDAGPP